MFLFLALHLYSILFKDIGLVDMLIYIILKNINK